MIKRLTKNFLASEFACPCGECDPEPDMDGIFMEKLQRYRDKVGPVVIVKGGGYRCRAYNEKIGGAKDSRHLYLTAADLKAKRVPHWVAVTAAEKIGFGGIGFGKGKLHVDGGKKRWWVYVSKEHVG